MNDERHKFIVGDRVVMGGWDTPFMTKDWIITGFDPIDPEYAQLVHSTDRFDQSTTRQHISQIIIQSEYFNCQKAD